MRKAFIAANWKMNKTTAQAAEFVDSLKSLGLSSVKADIALCVPFTLIKSVSAMLDGTSILTGGQNMHYLDKGAYTGEISADMLIDAGARCVIVGHSERRQYYNESDASVNKKTIKALEKGLIPIVCVGETLSERENGLTESVVEKSTAAALEGLSASDVSKLVLAYEPVWAIGTGKTATTAEANSVVRHIRAIVKRLFDASTADAVRILYGGSMNAKNAGELLAAGDIDGGLIGSAALEAQSFFDILRAT